ncbi:MAG: RNA polymerase sigma factor [Actinomycetota bacterium]|nr:RNA polymerase sigma factor [Actinomycetota bacterium]
MAEAYRQEWAFVLAATARVTRDMDLAEDCTAAAFAAAVESWRRDGVPRSPGAWLTTAARRRGLDELRRRKTLHAKLPLLLEPLSEMADAPADVGGIPDDRLRLVFCCCHPALAREAQVALTLRLVCGLPTADVARSFLVSEQTMAARVTRAKKKIAAARIPYRVPGAAELPERLDAVLTVVHLLFTAGHTAATGGRLVPDDLVARSLGLARTLAALMPDEREALALVGLILLTDARRSTRLDAGGRLVLLEDQDRSGWDRVAIDEGRALVRSALRGGRPGRLALQAAIAAVHAEAPRWSDTDWRQIVALYDLLLGAWPTPVVALNRAVAVAMADGPRAGLDEIGRIQSSPSLAGYRYLPAARADLLRRLGRSTEAAQAYRDALALTADSAERRFLLARLAQVTGVP